MAATPDVEELPPELRYIAHGPAYHQFADDEVAGIRAQLLAWFDAHRRRLPWRGDSPPFSAALSTDASTPAPPIARTVTAYETWVSEVMLQQTRVDTVISYFTRWMELFPTVEALAKASEEDVLRAWAGLGYYRRAKLLHKGAQTVVADMEGVLPATAAQLKRIPGIGDYTAGAIASIAFKQRAPLVDGNVIRVLSRLRGVAASPKHAALVAWCWEQAGRLVDDARPGDFNQALMELGATVCTPANPQCQACPVRTHCAAAREVAQSTPHVLAQAATVLAQAAAQADAAAAAAAAAAASAASPAAVAAEDADADADGATPPVKRRPRKASGRKAKSPAPATGEAAPYPLLPHCGLCSLTACGVPTTAAARYPLKAERAAQREVGVLALLLSLQQGNVRRCLMVQRPADGLLGGQWEWPSAEVPPEQLQSPAGLREAQAALARGVQLLVGSGRGDRDGEGSGCAAGDGEQVNAAVAAAVAEPGAWSEAARFTHVFTHLKHHVLAFSATVQAPPGPADAPAPTPAAPRARWVVQAELGALPTTLISRKALEQADSAPSAAPGASGKGSAKRARSASGAGSKARAKKARDEGGEAPAAGAGPQRTLLSMWGKRP